jgi:hypothetical protein
MAKLWTAVRQVARWLVAAETWYTFWERGQAAWKAIPPPIRFAIKAAILMVLSELATRLVVVRQWLLQAAGDFVSPQSTLMVILLSLWAIIAILARRERRSASASLDRDLSDASVDLAEPPAAPVVEQVDDTIPTDKIRDLIRAYNSLAARFDNLPTQSLKHIRDLAAEIYQDEIYADMREYDSPSHQAIGWIVNLYERSNKNLVVTASELAPGIRYFAALGEMEWSMAPVAGDLSFESITTWAPTEAVERMREIYPDCLRLIKDTHYFVRGTLLDKYASGAYSERLKYMFARVFTTVRLDPVDLAVWHLERTLWHEAMKPQAQIKLKQKSFEIFMGMFLEACQAHSALAREIPGLMVNFSEDRDDFSFRSKYEDLRALSQTCQEKVEERSRRGDLAQLKSVRIPHLPPLESYRPDEGATTV